MANTSKISENKKHLTAEEVEDVLKDIERKYSFNDYVDAPDSLNLDKVEVPNKTDEEIIGAVKNSLTDKYSKKKETTDQSFREKIESLLSSTQTLKDRNQESQDQINQSYDNSIKATENQALKRGLARSSIVISQISSLEGGRASDLSQSLKDLENKLSDAEKQIASLESEQQEALNNLEVEYALELEEEIQKAKDDYQKSVQEAINFNNNVDKLEAEYKLKLDKQKQDKQKTLTELKDKYDTTYTFNKIRDEQFNYLKDYLSELDKDYALSLLLTNREFKSVLGNRYKEMYDLISRG